ncbi:MAG TPA: glycosyltransferase family 2 protein [Ohtaekwangia sp.]|nr:glycosyltransferase family 2 protein [Ohtaekwangia sp.]
MLGEKVSVIISTYNAPEWLRRVLWGYENQDYKNFELIIADDGSGDETRELIQSFKQDTALDINHVWHTDRGFQKSEILNKATMAATTKYLIYSDGDCIPRKDFVHVHVQRAQPGYFLSGGYFMLPMETSKRITREDITTGNAFDVKWLYDHGLPATFKSLKLNSTGVQERFLNWITPTKATWNGHNSSGWKADIVSVNGFNEEMQYGGQDRELGERLVNKGIIGKQIRYSAVCIHLDHKRGYKTPASIQKNMAIRKETRRLRKTWTEFGIVKSKSPVGP